MSIFGERIRRPGPDIGTILSDYVKKHYVDAQDDLRVLKTDDTMVKRNPLITVWAENKRSMVDKRYEWSFGSDAARGYANGGYPMLAAGRVLRMGLSTTAPHNGVSDASVNISINGIENKSYGATRLAGQISGVSIFETPLELVQGDTINFKSVTHNPKIAGATVSLLIELDLLIPFFKQPPKMSIFGDRIHRGPDTAGDYAKKDYVDEQLALRVLKTGDTMTGDLKMAGGMIRGLPLTQPTGTTSYSDEAISSYHVLDLIMEALKSERKARRPLITVYAEEYGSMTEGEYEWSFGNGVSGGNSERGYPLAVSGRLKYMSLAITTASSRPSEARVEIVINGVLNHLYGVTKPMGQFSSFTEFRTPLELAAGDMINFRTATTNPEVSSAVVAAILDLYTN